MNFQQFKTAVKSKGGIWTSESVYFATTQKHYIAAYLPTYPERTAADEVLEYNHITNIWNYRKGANV